MLQYIRYMASGILFIILICVIVLQQREINSLGQQVFEINNEVKEKEQLALTYRNESAAKEHDLLKLEADFTLEKNKLNEKSDELQLENTNLSDELKRMNAVMLAALLDGSEKTPVVESSIPSDMRSIILNLYDAMRKDDIKEFQAIDVKEILANLYENREKIEIILWIRHDPDHRAKAFKNDFRPETEVDLLKVFFLYKDGSTIDPNFVMAKEHDKWNIFRTD